MTGRSVWGVLAEFPSHETLAAALGRMRASGYEKFDGYTPYAHRDLEAALGGHHTWLGWLTLVAGVTGTAAGLALQWYTTAVAYPVNIGGRPLLSWPAFVPVTFELGVLCAGLAAFIAVLVASGLPRPHHPLFGVPEFARATHDRFFLSVEATDARFHPERTRRLLESAGAITVRDVPAD